MTLYRLLGPVEVVRDGRPVELGPPKQRAVLAVLLLDAGRVVSTDRLIDAVWGDDHPPSVTASLQAYISNLRRLLRDDERATSPIVRQPPGYLVDVATEDLDVTRFIAGCETVQAAVIAAEWTEAVDEAERALALWRGPVLVEHADEDWVRATAAALDERRTACEQNLVQALLGSGRVSAALARAGRLQAAHPLDERTSWLHLIALYRAGRPADALQAYRDHTVRLDRELGLEPGPALRDLQGAILRQEPELASWPDAPTARRPLAAATHPPGVVEPQRPPLVTPGFDRDLIGRERELGVLEELLREARQAGPRWVLLTGVAGIGKSRLVEEVLPGWPGRVARTRCPDDDGVPPWWPIRAVLRELGADPDAVLAPPAGVDADGARFAVYERVAGVFATAAGEQPLLVYVDDVHWADPSSLRFLTYLAEAQAPAHQIVVLTARDGVDSLELARLRAAVARRAGSRHVALPPLDAGQVAELVASVSGQAVEASDAVELARHTGGNPFFVCEYARLPEDERRNGEIPVAVRSVLGRRLAGLDPAVLQVLRTAAVIGDVLDIDLLARVTRLDRDELADLLDEAADEHIIVTAPGSGHYTFAHALLRDEVTTGLSPLRRQRLHARIAEAIGPGGGECGTRRAAHLLAALPLVDAADVFDACRSAAVDAESRWHSDAAARWWGHAVDVFDLLPPDPGVDRDELVIAQVAALARAGRGQTVLDVVDAALLEAVRSARIASAGRLAAALLRAAGCWPWAAYGSDPAPLLARLAGLEPVVRADPGAHARILAALAVGSCYHPDADVPDTLSQRAITLAEQLGDPEVLADALLGRALTFSGVAARAPESVELLDRLAAVPHALGRVDDVIGHGLLSMAELVLGRSDAAAEHLRLGAVGSDLLRLPVSRAQLRWGDGTMALWFAADAADLAAAEGLFAAAFDMHRQTELYQAGVYFLARLSLRWVQGRMGELGHETGENNPGLAPWTRAVVAAARGDADADALIAAEVARAEPPVWTTHGRLTLLSHAVADRGLREHAAILRERLAPLAGCIANLGQVGVVGPVGLALARLCLLDDDLDGARRYLDQAGELSRKAGGVGSVLNCRLVSAQLDQRTGTLDPAEVREIAAESRRCGLAGVARAADQLIRADRADPSSTRGAPVRGASVSGESAVDGAAGPA